MVKVDALGKRLLGMLMEQPGATVSQLAGELDATPEAIVGRLKKLQESVIGEWIPNINPKEIGLRYEFEILVQPNQNASQQDLEKLCYETGITRVYTRTNRRSIGYILIGSNPQKMHKQIANINNEYGFTNCEINIILTELQKDPLHGLKTRMDEISFE